MTGPSRLSSVPKVMLPVYEKIVRLTDDVCDRYLNSEYRDLARALTGALCRKRPSPVASGEPRTWACSIVYVLGRMNFLSDKSFSPHMTTADLCAAFDVGDARYRKSDWGPAVRSAVDASELGREEPAGMDGTIRGDKRRFGAMANARPDSKRAAQGQHTIPETLRGGVF